MLCPSVQLPAVFPLASREDTSTQGAAGEGGEAGRLAVVALHHAEPIGGAAAGAQHTGQPLNAAFTNAGVLQGSPGISHCGEEEHRNRNQQGNRLAATVLAEPGVRQQAACVSSQTASLPCPGQGRAEILLRELHS